MLIYGTSGAKNLKTQHHVGSTCPHCNETGTMESGVFSRYAHVYWIPLFTLGKTSVTQCTSCGTEITANNRPVEVDNQVQDLKKDNPIPFWHFSGVILIALMITFGIFQSKQDAKDNAEFIANPMVGDVYEFGEASSYSAMRVLGVEGDSVVVVFNQYETNKKSSLDELRKKPYMSSDSAVVFPKNELVEWYNSKYIFDVIR